MRKMQRIAMLLAAAVVAGCQTSTTEDNSPVPVDVAKSNPGPSGGSTSASGGAEPLRLDSAEAAALLGVDDRLPEAALEADPGKRINNFRCLVCHGNFSNEELSIIHAANGVGCEECHGSSDAHCADENNITPPGIMYSRDTIVKACMRCHPAEKLSDKEHHWDVFAPKDDKPKKVCTDCHGEHRIPSRDVRWNKKTGELIKGGWTDQSEK